MKTIFWKELSEDLINNHTLYHEHFYKEDKFSGPSHYFHLRALNASKNEKSEMVYALLVSWGMHRMGGGAQMNDYGIFKESLESNLKEIEKQQTSSLEDISDKDWELLKNIFNELNPMRSKRKLVAISKILAHYLPGIIAPIDNEYTIQFINQKPRQKILPFGWEEFDLLKEIHMQLFRPVLLSNSFKTSAKEWLNNAAFMWDTSILKIIDNLIIGKISYLKKNDKEYMKPSKNIK